MMNVLFASFFTWFEKVPNFAQTAQFYNCDICLTFSTDKFLVRNLDEHHQTGVLKLLFGTMSEVKGK